MRWNIVGVLLAFLAACAKFGPVPGGPPDVAAPVLLTTRPESLGVYPGFNGYAEFRFDETVSEGISPNFGLGNGDLERMIVLSPSTGVPKIRWERSRIAVRPREGWRPNTVYRIELLPGLADLRRNRDKRGQVITFTTGAPLPTDSLSGVLIDWVARGGARQATVEAILLPDSLVYRTETDSSGRFVLAPLPHGSYLLRGYVDQNRDRRLDGKENWDTLSVAAQSVARTVLWLAPRDTVPVKVIQATVRDSTAVDIQLSQPIDPTQSIDTTNIVVRLLPDSTPVALSSFRTRGLDDSLSAGARATTDSLRADSVRRARPDSGQHAAPAAKPAEHFATPATLPPLSQRGRPRAPVDSTVIKLAQTRPALVDRLVLRTAHPLPPESKYVLEVRGIRNLNLVTGNAVGGFTVPKPPPPPKVDSTRTDSTRRAGPTGPPGRAHRAEPDSATRAPAPAIPPAKPGTPE